MKNQFRVLAFLGIILSLLIFTFSLTTCKDPAEDDGMGRFTIDFGDSSRAITYPPTSGDIPNLRFEVKFYSGTTLKETFIGDGKTILTGRIVPGNYKVDVDVFLKTDGDSLLSLGEAVSNPVTINPGNNIIPVALHKAVTITPSTATVAPGTTQTFSAAVYGLPPATPVTWARSGNNNAGTTINATTGVLTVAAGETATALEVTASYGSSPVWKGAVNVTVSAATPTITVSTIAGDGTAGLLDHPTDPLLAQFNYPNNIALDSSGNLYVADAGNNRIRKINGLTGEVTIIAGDASFSGFIDNPNPLLCRFSFTNSIVVDNAGTIYIPDNNNNRIRKIDGGTGVQSVFAGSGGYGFIDSLSPLSAQFANPLDLAFDSAGNLYVADNDNNAIRKIDLGTGEVSTVAGSGTSGFADGPGATAQFWYPCGIAVDSAGNVFVVDRGNHCIRKIDTAGVVSTIAGTPGTFGFADGPGASAQFMSPSDVAVDSSGNLFVADTNNNCIRRIDGVTGEVSTIAGTGTAGLVNGSGLLAQFNYPTGIIIDSAGDLYVADQSNHVIRKITF